jgi:hypothetical protein
MNGVIESALGSLRGLVRVDTPERWQGLERKVMVVVHPLSGVVSPSGFDLGTGRLCVMASRHRAGLVVVSRDHIPDMVGRGHFDHLAFWERLESDGRVLPLSA